jgi:hypothetical protein
MATIDTEIVQARYDLRDEDATQYPQTMMEAYFNRAVRALSDFLGSIRSDWVLESDTKIIVAAANFFVLPDDFSSPIVVKINNNPLSQRKPADILEQQEINSNGTPDYYGIHQLNMIFNRAVTANTDVYFQYNSKPTTLALGLSMPYNDEFNDVVRGAVVMLAKNRNERDITGDYALHTFYRDTVMGKTMRRIRKENVNLGF